jgi:hypothetical protein
MPEAFQVTCGSPPADFSMQGRQPHDPSRHIPSTLYTHFQVIDN